MPKKAATKLSSPSPGTKGGAGEKKKYSKKELEVLKKIKVKKKTVSDGTCVACSGTGKSSSGSRCYPCSGRGKK